MLKKREDNLGDYLVDARKESNYSRRVNDLLSWAVAVGAVFALIGFGFAVLQVVSSTDEFWMARGFFVLAAIVAAGRIILWGLTTSRGLTVRLIVGIIACGLIVALAIEGVRYVNRKSNLWIKSRLTINEVSRAQTSDKESEEPISTFVCVDKRIAGIEYIRGFCTESTSQENMRAPVVAFGNKGNKASMKNAVMARITFYDSEGKHLQHVNNGVWLEEETTSIQFFSVGEVRELVLALLPIPSVNEIYAFDNQMIWEIKTAHKELRVEVTLIGGLFPHTLGVFNFRLMLEPELAIEEIKTDFVCP